MDSTRYKQILSSVRDDVEGERGRLAEAIVARMEHPGGWDLEAIKELGALHAAVLALDAELARKAAPSPAGQPTQIGDDGWPIR